MVSLYTTIYYVDQEKYMFQLCKTTIFRLHTSEVHKDEII